MIVFVSYIRKDHDLAALRRIEALVAVLGQPYIDDIYDHQSIDRGATVECALWSADAFVAVVTSSYLQTPWTQWEFKTALIRQIPIFALAPNGAFDRFVFGRCPEPMGHYAELDCLEAVDGVTASFS